VLGSWIRTLVVTSSLATAGLGHGDERFELTPFWGVTTLDTRATREPGGGSLQFDDRFEQGFQLGARFGFRANDRMTLEGEYRYSPNGKFVVGFEDRGLGGIDLEVPIDVGSHAVTGGVVYELTRSERWRPFAAATIGLEHFRTGRGETGLRTGLGGGVRRSWRPGVAVRVDVRYVLWPSFFLTDATEGALEIDAGLSFGF
jgi:hypothetical protein